MRTATIRSGHAGHHAGAGAPDGHGAHDKHAGHDPEQFRRKFWLSFALTVPIVLTADMVMDWFGYELDFTGIEWVGPVLGSVVFFWGGWPFLEGAWREIRARQPGMMLLIGMAITVAYVASLATSLDWFDLDFWWELSLLVTIMLLGHWQEMKALGQAQDALAALAAAVERMTELNDRAAEALRPFEPHAVTDVTGFGLFGHAHELAERSDVRVVLDPDALPALDGALEAASAGVRTGGDRRNREFAPVEADGASEAALALGYDPQTAGGLLVALPADKGALVTAAFAERGLLLARIGRVEAGRGVALA